MIRVTCAIIEDSEKVLAARRSPSMAHPMKWEFPGGKVEAGESAEACMIREIREELGLEIRILRRQEDHIFTYPGQSPILFIPFVCEIAGGELKLLEHQEVIWADREALPALDWAEADVGVLQAFLASCLNFQKDQENL